MNKQPAESLSKEQYISNPLEATIVSALRLIQTNIISLILLALLTFASVGLLITAFLVAGVINFNAGNTLQTGWLILIGFLLILLITIIINVASDYLLVKSQKLQIVSVKSALARGIKRFWVALGTSILLALIVLAGLLLLIIPGLYLALRLSYTLAIVANEDLGPIDSLKRSWELTKGNLWDIIGAVATVTVIVSATYIILYGLTHLLAGAAGAASYLWIADLIVGVMSIPLVAILYFRYHQSDLSKSNKLTKSSTDSLNYLMVAPALILLAAYAAYATYLAPLSDDAPFDSSMDYDIEQIFNINSI